MSNSPKITLNLAALKKPDTQPEVENINASETKAIEEKSIATEWDTKENIAPKNTSETEKNQEWAPKERKTSLISLSSLTKKEPSPEKIKKEIQVKDKNPEEKPISAISKVWENSQESKPKNTSDDKKAPEEKIEFANYTSHFEKESKNVFKSIQNFSYAPKTRMWLIVTLLWCTILCISSLMLLFPEKHSLDIYKTSILYIYEQRTEKAEEDNDLSSSSQDINITPEIETQPEPTSEEDPFDIEKHRKEKLQDHLFQKYNN